MAEVKVKITAQNEVRTGFQQALQEAKKFGTEASRVAKIEPTTPTFSGEGGLKPMRDIQRRIQERSEQAREVASPQQQEGGGIAGALGRIPIIGAAAAATGRILADQFDKVNQSVLNVVAGMERFSSAFRTAVDATTVESAIGGFNQLNAISEQTAKTLQGLKMDLGANFANLVLGGDPFRELQKTAESQRLGAFSALSASSALHEDIANRRGAVAGDKNAEEILQRRLKDEAELRALENLRPLARTPDERLQLDNAIESTRSRQNIDERAVLDRSDAEDRKRFEEGQSREREASARKAEREAQEQQRQLTGGREFGPGTAEAARGGFRVDQANFAIQQQQEALLAAQGGASPQLQGSFGASDLQRIGFASDEFFDTRQNATPADIAKEIKRNADFTKQVVDLLKNPNTLVMKSEF